MRINKHLLLAAAAAMVLASCSENDDNIPTGGEPGGEKGKILDAVSVSFEGTPGTYADDTENGVGTENNIYHAFIFAREAQPGHDMPLIGDWTVKEIGTLGSTTPLNGALNNLAVFKGVQQGDTIFVIVNDPVLTLEQAKLLAYNGTASYTKIKEYTTILSKKYLNGMTKAAGVEPDGSFVMAGMSVIPTSPNIANGSTVNVGVTLNREMAKVSFSGQVTTDPSKEACGRVEIKKTAGTWGNPDGLIVVRIPHRVSFFSPQLRDWYFPLSGDRTTKDWAFDDTNKDIWLTAFPGEKNSNPTTVATGDEVFNITPFNPEASEYRYTWMLNATDSSNGLVTMSNNVLVSPIFYVTPNYAENAGCATVVVTQATYTGHTTVLPAFTAEVLQQLSITISSEDYWETPANVSALLAAVKGYSGSDVETLELKTKYAAETDATKLVDYIKDKTKLYYRADVAQYANAGAISLMNTERNTSYRIRGTITSLGAKNIEDAINTDDISMVVRVTVNPWRLSINSIDM